MPYIETHISAARTRFTLQTPTTLPARAAATFGKFTIYIESTYTDFAAFFQKEMSKRNREEDNEDEVPLHYILEVFFADDEYISRDKLQSLLIQASKIIPASLMRPWRSLRQLIEAWTLFQEQTMNNQEHHEEELQKIYNPLRCGHCNYKTFQREEELCTMSFPPETTEKLRTFVLKLLNDSNSDQHNTQSQQSLYTLTEPASHTSTSFTTVAGATEAADVLHSVASLEDQTARLFGLQTQPLGTSSILSSICIATPESWNTLKWEEQIGLLTVELKIWDNAGIRDTNPQEFWKYCTRNLRVQLHATTQAEVRQAIQTIIRYAHERVTKQKPENVKREQRKNPSMTGSGRTQYRH